MDVPGDTPSYRKHSKDWYALTAFIEKGHNPDSLKMPDRLADGDFFLFCRLFNARETLDGDVLELLGSPGGIDFLTGLMMSFMDGIAHCIRTENRDFNEKEKHFSRNVLSGITSREHPLYACVDMSANSNFTLDVFSLMQRAIREHRMGSHANLNWIDVSAMTDFSDMFRDTGFDGDISLWCTEAAGDMSEMFMDSAFDGDISGWGEWLKPGCEMRDAFTNSSIPEMSRPHV